MYCYALNLYFSAYKERTLKRRIILTHSGVTSVQRSIGRNILDFIPGKNNCALHPLFAYLNRLCSPSDDPNTPTHPQQHHPPPKRLGDITNLTANGTQSQLRVLSWASSLLNNRGPPYAGSGAAACLLRRVLLLLKWLLRALCDGAKGRWDLIETGQQGCF
jgi:hypothetical protein